MRQDFTERTVSVGFSISGELSLQTESQEELADIHLVVIDIAL
jgi:hypothetical protein